MKKLLLIISIFLYAQANDIELTGTVISDNEKVITSRNMGFIKEVYVVEGSWVKKGDLLYEIDSSSIDSKKQEALLNLKIQQNTYNNIKTNYERYKRLYAKDLVAKYDVEKLELNLLNVQNMISIAKAQLKEVNAQYDYLKIKAPNDGLIIKKSIKAGEMATPSIPALILSDLSSLKIKAEVSESNLNSVKLGQDVSISIPSINFESLGKISAIIPSVNAMTHSFTLKIAFDKKDQTIYPGMYTKLLIKSLN
ncbi:efflux RND transporter periplasmic adaptor subunit [Arcobacter sp. YIC-464]|uniref:efflux RND transporter periplasmic adaptor subunit n=1 Tax=Arcobacter sp. YIC-464 TaxID=3376631 RepID=UPI003C20945E